MSTKKNYHMNAEDFRRHGYAMIDWIAEYWDSVEDYPVLSPVEPNQLYSSLPAECPTEGESLSRVMEDFQKIILPGITHWQSPNFFAYFPTGASGPSILGDLLSSGLGIQGMLWSTSPACTELEMKMMDWLVHLLGLPKHFLCSEQGGGTLQDSASSASLVALLAARERAVNYSMVNQGLQASVLKGKLIAYVSTETHSSLDKAMSIAGLGSDNLRKVTVDEKFAMNAAELQELIQKDKAQGNIPFFICATIGTTSSNGIDDLQKIGEISQQENCWLHVDAAMSGSAMVCPEYRYLQQGVELADSYNFNPHKWLFTNFDCSALFVKNKSDIIHALSILPEYLKNKATESGEVIDYRDWQIPLGRRFRALKLWFALRHYGVKGLQEHIREHIEIAQTFAQWLRESKKFEIMAPHPLNLVCFRHVDGDEKSKEILETLNKEGKIYLTHTKLNGSYVIRFCVGQMHTQMQHVENAWNLINNCT